ncbi:centrosome and spindle pole-associated protein 1 isoform X3 [Mugil cephalus]|uniref:centrosome and spindle pole-associated protein 1 isoform X3 n=1 Tax=Mugil cephalus TaxID=48193 RepID=UPI001FB767A8|nr:centrosome and spindle pole-associated protein 1 isoform X3 [Mugil cephalus]
MPAASAAQGITPYPDRGLGLTFLLGTEYERRKQKLQQELQQDFQHYVSKKDLKTSEHHSQPQGLSLPIYEKISEKEKLREERNKEYNLFLQEQAQNRKLKRGTTPVSSKAGQTQASDAANVSARGSYLHLHLNAYSNMPPSPSKARPASRRDAATETEVVDNGKSTGTYGLGHRQRRLWQSNRPKEPYSSEEESLTNKEEGFDFQYGRGQDRFTQDPKCKEERTTQEHRVNSMRPASRSAHGINKDESEFATGLTIGAAEDHSVSQMRKERYKQELLQQIAEKQRNKMMEKTLEPRVAATGAKDPEKEPDRIKQFGAVPRQYYPSRPDTSRKSGLDLEATEKNPNPRPKYDKRPDSTEQTARPKNSQVDHREALNQLPGNAVPGSGKGVAQGVSSFDYFSEDYHRAFSRTLGGVAMPRVAGAAPPVPPVVPNTYKTPHDAAYYYYGARDPLDPNLPHNQTALPGELQQSGIPSQRPPLRSSSRTETAHQHRASPVAFDELYEERSKQRRRSVLSYQEALRQQIKEREESKRREKEEKERYDAKIEAEMMAYNPWGKSGGGAPIKDQKGNLVNNLYKMHRINEETYRNPRSSPGAETVPPLSHRLSDFKDQSSPSQLHRQDSYKEALKRQIEENKRKQEEERERFRIEEEKEEKRLANQRARIQEEYEREQRKQKKAEHRTQNQSWILEPKTRPREEEKDENERVPQSVRAAVEKRSMNHEREPSPPIPALQRKPTNLMPSRCSSVVSQVSPRTERSVSAPHQTVTARMPQLQDGQEDVIRELSALRRYLRKEQKQLEVQLGQAGPQEAHYTPPNRRRPRADAFESVHEESVQSPLPAVNKQNVREFNQLKYRDTASREEVQAMYPDPPTDAQSLDIQQQALLREQQRKHRLLNRPVDHDVLNYYYPRTKPGSFAHRDSSTLPSETVFLDVYSGDACEEHRGRTATRRRRNCDTRGPSEAADSVDQREPDPPLDNQSLQGASSLSATSKTRAHNQPHYATRDSFFDDPSSRSEGLSGDELDASSLRSALGRPVSVDTVATEPWLRPGTPRAVIHGREKPNSRMDAPPWMTHRIT